MLRLLQLQVGADSIYKKFEIRKLRAYCRTLQATMPIIEIKLLEGRSPDAIARLIRKVTDAVEHSIAAPRDTIRILVNEVPRAHWGTGGETKDSVDESLEASGG